MQDRDAQKATVAKTQRLVREEPGESLRQARSRFGSFQLPDELLDAITKHYSLAPEQQLLSCLLHFEGADEDSSQRHHPFVSGFTISSAYFFGGFIPLLPYIFSSAMRVAFYLSVAITATVLFSFGTIKTLILGDKGTSACLKGGVEMLVLGGVAAAAAILCVKILDGRDWIS